MAYTFAHLTNGTVAAASGNTASITPTANRLILVRLRAFNSASSSIAATATASGNGITYTQVVATAVYEGGNGYYRDYLLRGLAASPSSGVIAVAVTTSETIGWTVDEVGGILTTGSNGADAVVQSATNTTGIGTPTPVTTFTVTMGAFASGSNAAYGSVSVEQNVTVTPEAGWTELYDGAAGGANMPEVQYLTSSDTTATWTFDSVSYAGGIAIEIAAAAAASANQGNTLTSQTFLAMRMR